MSFRNTQTTSDRTYGKISLESTESIQAIGSTLDDVFGALRKHFAWCALKLTACNII